MTEKPFADSVTEPHTFLGMVGNHPAMRRVFELIRRIGPSPTSVLITGESGTGKELVARALHDLSPRRADNFVPVHCGAIPEELLESELFGHVKGAFTGAIASRTGRFRLAHGGTIFLDEIGEMTPRFQVKLLRVLEDGCFEPVGSVASQRVDVRVVAATHRDLRSLADEGTFRPDLLYRLDVVAIHLPPLRERREDIPLLARHFLRRLSAKGLPHFDIAEETAALLMAYDWPGNVRELRNVLERSALLSNAPGVLRPADLPPHLLRPAQAEGCPPRTTGSAPTRPWPWDFGPEGTDFYLELDAFERKMIGRALELARGSKREAARLLQLNRTTLIEKLKRKGWEFERLAEGDEAVRPEPANDRPAVPTALDPVPTLATPQGVDPLATRDWPAIRRPSASFLPSGRTAGAYPQRAVV